MVKIATLNFEKDVEGKDVISILEEIEQYFGVKTLEGGEFEIHDFK